MITKQLVQSLKSLNLTIPVMVKALDDNQQLLPTIVKLELLRLRRKPNMNKIDHDYIRIQYFINIMSNTPVEIKKKNTNPLTSEQICEAYLLKTQE